MSLPSLIFLLFTAIRFTWSSEQRHRLGALKTVSHHKLEGHQIKIVKGSTLLSCAQSCLTEPNCMSTNFGVSPVENRLVCELNDHSVSLISNDDLLYAEGYIFSLYSETFQTSGSDTKVNDILFYLNFHFFLMKTKERPLEPKCACYCLQRFDSFWKIKKECHFIASYCGRYDVKCFCFIPVITLITLSLLLFCFQSGYKHITCLNEGQCYFNEDKK